MRRYEVGIVQKEWYTAEVVARSPEEAKRIVRSIIMYDEPPLNDEELRSAEENPPTLFDDFWEDAKHTGYIEAELEDDVTDLGEA